MDRTGNRYRWEFRLLDGEDEAGLITPQALGLLLRPWTGRADLEGTARRDVERWRGRVPTRSAA